MSAVELGSIVLLAAAVGIVIGLWLSRRQAMTFPPALPETFARLEATQRQLSAELASLRESVGEVRGRLADAGQHQQNLTLSLQSLQQVLSDAQAKLAALQRGEEEAQRRQQEMADVLARLEAVVAGARSRGLAGERILKAVLDALPPEYKIVGQKINGREVELAFRLPNGKCVPIDSKWVAARELERLATCSDEAERVELVRKLERALEKKIEEVASYLDPELTIGLGIAAVPEAVYHTVERAHAHALQRGVVIIAYTMAVPYLLTLLQLCARFLPRSEFDPARLNAFVQQIAQALEQIDRELNGRFADALTRLQNSRRDLQHFTSDAQQALIRLSQSTSVLLDGEPAMVQAPQASPSQLSA